MAVRRRRRECRHRRVPISQRGASRRRMRTEWCASARRSRRRARRPTCGVAAAVAAAEATTTTSPEASSAPGTSRPPRRPFHDSGRRNATAPTTDPAPSAPSIRFFRIRSIRFVIVINPLMKSLCGRYSTDYAESGSGKPELTKTERLRSYQTPPPSSASRETAPFRSRFLRSSLDSAPAAGSSSSTSSRGHVDVDNGPDARADARPSVSSLRRRYDLNCNPVADSVRNSVRNSVNFIQPFIHSFN